MQIEAFWSLSTDELDRCRQLDLRKEAVVAKRGQLVKAHVHWDSLSFIR